MTNNRFKIKELQIRKIFDFLVLFGRSFKYAISDSYSLQNWRQQTNIQNRMVYTMIKWLFMSNTFTIPSHSAISRTCVLIPKTLDILSQCIRFCCFSVYVYHFDTIWIYLYSAPIWCTQFSSRFKNTYALNGFSFTMCSYAMLLLFGLLICYRMMTFFQIEIVFRIVEHPLIQLNWCFILYFTQK